MKFIVTTPEEPKAGKFLRVHHTRAEVQQLTISRRNHPFDTTKVILCKPWSSSNPNITFSSQIRTYL